MATKQKAAKTVVDAATITMLDTVEIPKDLNKRGSKYPWARLVANGGNGGFHVPFENKKKAEDLRSSIQSSGRTYLKDRGLPYKALAFVGEQNGKIGVTCAIVRTDGESAEE